MLKTPDRRPVREGPKPATKPNAFRYNSPASPGKATSIQHGVDRQGMAKLLATLFLAAGIAGSSSALAAHAFALYDTPKYPAGFHHFDYVNPDAPKGGELYL